MSNSNWEWRIECTDCDASLSGLWPVFKHYWFNHTWEGRRVQSLIGWWQSRQ